MKTKIRKAVIPAAGLGVRLLPATKAIPKEMLPLVNKPTIQYIVEEAVKSGIEQILVIISSKKTAILDHFDYDLILENALIQKNKLQEHKEIEDIANLAHIFFVRQKNQDGLGDAILFAESFVGNEDFAVLLGDDVVFSKEPALKQCLEAYYETNCQTIGVQEVDPCHVDKYGIITPEGDYKNKDLIKVLAMTEKPKPKDAKSNLAILGRYVLKPSIFKALRSVPYGVGGELQLTDGLNFCLKNENFYARKFTGTRFDVGTKSGFIKANLFTALNNKDISKKEVLELLNLVKA